MCFCFRFAILSGYKGIERLSGVFRFVVENHVRKFKIRSKTEHSQFNFPILILATGRPVCGIE